MKIRASRARRLFPPTAAPYNVAFAAETCKGVLSLVFSFCTLGVQRVFAVMNSRTVLPESPQKKARQDRALQYENMACASHAPAGGGCRPSGFSESSAFCRAFFLPSPVFFLFFATAEKQRKITGIREIFRFFQKKMHFPCRAPVFFKKTLTIEGPNLIFMFVAILHLKNCF